MCLMLITHVTLTVAVPGDLDTQCAAQHLINRNSSHLYRSSLQNGPKLENVWKLFRIPAKRIHITFGGIMRKFWLHESAIKCLLTLLTRRKTMQMARCAALFCLMLDVDKKSGKMCEEWGCQNCCAECWSAAEAVLSPRVIGKSFGQQIRFVHLLCLCYFSNCGTVRN